MLTVLDALPERLLDTDATDLHGVLPGPTLIHLGGRRAEPLFVSVMLHGDEETGWVALRELLRRHAGRELPRALSLFIGNVVAARHRVRFLPGQPDYNRVWNARPAVAAGRPEHRMMQQVLEAMRARRVFASIDIHNNTGINPHYACVRRLDPRHLHLATLFSRTVVYFTKPEGVQTAAFSRLCPAVTVECGRSSDPHGAAHALEFLEACLRLSAVPEHPVAPHDIDLFHSVAIVKVPPDATLGIGPDAEADIRLIEDLDHLNFRELPAGTLIGWIRPGSRARLEAWDEQGRETGARFFGVRDGEIRLTVPVMPSMLTVDLRAIRQDCLGYLMERYLEFYGDHRAAGLGPPPTHPAVTGKG